MRHAELPVIATVSATSRVIPTYICYFSITLSVYMYALEALHLLALAVMQPPAFDQSLSNWNVLTRRLGAICGILVSNVNATACLAVVMPEASRCTLSASI